MSLAQPTYGQINAEQNDRLREVAPDRDGPLFMLNLMRYRPLAVYEDGRETTLTGMQTDDVYAPVEILPTSVPRSCCSVTWSTSRGGARAGTESRSCATRRSSRSCRCRRRRTSSSGTSTRPTAKCRSR
jgi:hypothetical protein